MPEVSSHGALVAIEKDGDAAGTFTAVAEQTGEQAIEFIRGVTETTPHNDKIDKYVVGVMRRGPVTVAGSFIYNEATHDQATGIQKRWLDGDNFGIRWRGPSGAASTDEIIASGHVTSFRRTAAAREGVYGFEATFQLSGQMIVDGVTFGS